MISIITPTYNREHTLSELYVSLKNQSSKNFEWIIIDDGSIDHTRALVDSFYNEDSGFPIYYHYKKNGGKHTAVNAGVNFAHGDFVFIVDSDDELVEDAVETIDVWIKNIDSPQIAAVAGTRGHRNGQRIGGFPEQYKGSYVDAKNTDRRKLNLLGDKAEIYRTEILKKYPFKEFDGERFLTEASVWDEIAFQGYYVRWYDKTIYLCEYLSDGLTQSGGDQRDINNFEGFTYSTQQRIKCHSTMEGVMAKGRYVYIAKKKGMTLSQMKSKLHCSVVSLMICNVIWRIKNIVRKIV